MPRCFSSKNGEIDFVQQCDMDIIFVEMKGSKN